MVSAVSFEFRVTLHLFVFGIGSTGLFFGIAMAREQAAAGELFDETGPTSGSESDELVDTNTDGA